jgi:DNA replication protein DnaC
MHIEQVLSQLHQMRLTTMATSLKQRLATQDHKGLSHEEFFALIVDDEYYARKERKMKQKIGRAHFKPELPTIEDLVYDMSRGFAKQDIMPFTSPEWVNNSQNVIITGPTGSGKTYLAEAIAHQACRLDFDALKTRCPILMEEIHGAKGTGTYLKLLKKFAKIKVLIIDDFLMQAISIEESSYLMDIIDEKQQTGSLIITTQYPVSKWHQRLPDPTIADALCDRLVHKAYMFELGGDSMRKKDKKSVKQPKA